MSSNFIERALLRYESLLPATFFLISFLYFCIFVFYRPEKDLYSLLACKFLEGFGHLRCWCLVKSSTKKTNVMKPWIWVVIGVVCAILFVGFFFVSSFFLLLSTASGSETSTGVGNVAVIPVEGAIAVAGSGSYFSEGGASSEVLVKRIRSASDDEHIEAIILLINSPGGSAVASDEIAAAVLQSEKPTVAVIREVGASGGYWVASAADYVIANRMSITGSIGVISSYLEFSEFMDEYGVGYQRLVAGESKDVGSPFRVLADSEEELLQGKIDLIHDYFIDAIAANRGLERMAVAAAATGEFYLGAEALELGLVDELGDLDTAKRYLQDEKGVEITGLVEYGGAASFWDLLAELSVLHGLGMGKSIGSEVATSNGNVLKNSLHESGVRI